MNGKPRKTASGASQRVTGDIIRRFRNVRALWMAVMNDPRPADDMTSEFFFKVGELLEGKQLSDLSYYAIDRDRVLRHAEDS